MLDNTTAQAYAVRDPALRAYLLLQLAEAWKRANTQKVSSTLADAFRATSEIDDRNRDEKQTKLSLQGAAMRQLTVVDPLRMENLIAEADPKIERDFQLRRLSLLIEKKDVSRAMELVEAIAAQGTFPFDSASALMLALPRDADDEQRQRLFALAVQAHLREEYRPQVTVPPSGLVNLIVRFWHGLPPPLVLQAVDALLARSKEIKGPGGFQLTMASPAGAVSFDSDYEANVFYVMPVLKVLDPRRADKLLEESSDRREMASKFPGGLQTLDPTVRDSALKEGERPQLTGAFRASSMIGASTEDRVTAELKRAVGAIVTSAKENPREALRRALSLPPSSGGISFPRSDALIEIANVAKKTNQNIAKEALDDLVATAGQLECLPHATYLGKTVRLYLEIGETDAAMKAISEGLKLAEKQYVDDTKSDDPNLAMKAYWPSTVIWQKFVLLAGQVSSKAALDALQGVSDEESQVCVRAALLNQWLGAKQSHSRAVNRRKDAGANFELPVD